MAVVGPSVPARRPFFSQPENDVPDLIAAASQFSTTPIFQYSLAGGWPSVNSIIRLLTSLLAVCCSFSFALIASLLAQKTSRLLFSILLLLTTLLGLAAVGLDTHSIVNTARECADQNCKTAVPEKVIKDGHKCMCTINGWFYCALVADIILVASAVICLMLTVRATRKRRAVDPIN